jgi:hypothetical protein
MPIQFKTGNLKEQVTWKTSVGGSVEVYVIGMGIRGGICLIHISRCHSINFLLFLVTLLHSEEASVGGRRGGCYTITA